MIPSHWTAILWTLWFASPRFARNLAFLAQNPICDIWTSEYLKATCRVRLFDMTVLTYLASQERFILMNMKREVIFSFVTNLIQQLQFQPTATCLQFFFAVIDWWWNPAYQSFAECLSVDIVFPSSEWTLLHEISRKEFCAIPSGSSGSALN